MEIPGQCGWNVVARPKQLMKLVQARRWEAGVSGPGLSFHGGGEATPGVTRSGSLGEPVQVAV